MTGWELHVWLGGWWRKSAADRAEWGGYIGGSVAAAAVEVEVVEVVEVAAAAVVVGVARGGGGGRGLAWQERAASFLLLLGALAQLEGQQAGNRVRVGNNAASRKDLICIFVPGKQEQTVNGRVLTFYNRCIF